MNVQYIYQEILDRLNKLNKGAGQKLDKRSFVMAFNKMQQHWYDERIKVKNQTHIRVEELQPFIKEFCGSPSDNKKQKYCYINLPDDYFRTERVWVLASKGECQLRIRGRSEVFESNVDTWLIDENLKPSFEWQESFYTLGGNRIKFYHNDAFKCDQISLFYYKCLTPIDCEGIIYPDGKKGVNVNPELDKTNLEEVLDMVTLLLSGDVGDANVYKAMTEQIKSFN